MNETKYEALRFAMEFAKQREDHNVSTSYILSTAERFYNFLKEKPSNEELC